MSSDAVCALPHVADRLSHAAGCLSGTTLQVLACPARVRSTSRACCSTRTPNKARSTESKSGMACRYYLNGADAFRLKLMLPLSPERAAEAAAEQLAMLSASSPKHAAVAAPVQPPGIAA